MPVTTKPLTLLLLATASVHALEPQPLMDTVVVNGIELNAKSPPKGLVLDTNMGLLTMAAVEGQVVHRTQKRILETRATITPKGDYLLMFPEGDHYAKSKGEKINSMMTCRSTDKGKTWTKPAPSTLVHPDAPPMLFPLSDGRTLVAFHHNKVPTTNHGDLNDHAELMRMRSEVWASLSTDEGHTWSEPHFVLANAVAPIHKVSGFNSQCSYIDAFTENGVMHLFMPHRWQQVLYLTIKEDALGKLPTKAQLQQLMQ